MGTEQIEQKLKSCGLAFEALKVFGAIRLNVHVKCVSHATAEKWASLLSAMGGQVIVKKTVWEAKENKGTTMLPTVRQGFLVAFQGSAA